ncbi:PH domain-containing protein [Natronomonas moolapensis]|uniref:PH domain-containing protein n=1 Tax=Natronomonas moolapensis TaxID=416273 RepID=UPI00097988F6
MPDVEALTGDPQTLEPAIQGVWVIQSAISAAVLGIIAAVIFSVVSPGGAWVGAVVFVVTAALGIVFSLLKYRIWMYQVRDDSLYLKRGVLTRVNTVAPYVRIQHVDTRRGPVERAFGLATTVVYTAGSRGADVSIPGLTPERADDLQTRLKHLAIAAEGDDAV